VAAWLAGEKWLVDALDEGKDVYRITAAQIYRSRPEDITSEQRQLGKVVELASQFGLSGRGRNGDGGLYARLLAEGIHLSAISCDAAISVYRKTHPKIVAMWKALDTAVYKLLRAPHGCVEEVGRLRLIRYVLGAGDDDACIAVVRPSGFRQYLWFPKYRDGVVYTGRLMSGAMGTLSTYGAKLFQGAVQGAAADLIYAGGRAAERAGYAPIMAVHDELVTEVDATDRTKSVEGLCEIMCNPGAEWADGLPVKAEGWRGNRFTK
jgi:DNA polymerase